MNSRELSGSQPHERQQKSRRLKTRNARITGFLDRQPMTRLPGIVEIAEFDEDASDARLPVRHSVDVNLAKRINL
jgi:hypothetical protein